MVARSCIFGTPDVQVAVCEEASLFGKSARQVMHVTWHLQPLALFGRC